jgi:hypothetical protein
VQAAPIAAGDDQDAGLRLSRAARGARAEQRLREALQLISASQIQGNISATAAAMYEGLMQTFFVNQVAGEDDEDEDVDGMDDEDDDYEDDDHHEYYDAMNGDEEEEDGEFEDASEGSASDGSSMSDSEH